MYLALNLRTLSDEEARHQEAGAVAICHDLSRQRVRIIELTSGGRQLPRINSALSIMLTARHREELSLCYCWTVREVGSDCSAS